MIVPDNVLMIFPCGTNVRMLEGKHVYSYIVRTNSIVHYQLAEIEFELMLLAKYKS